MVCGEGREPQEASAPGSHGLEGVTLWGGQRPAPEEACV